MAASDSSSTRRVIRARWVLPVDGPPIADGKVVVDQGRILSVARCGEGDRTDCENVAVIPKLINAHTHLEFSSLKQPLGEKGMPFTDWIRRVIAWRRARDADAATAESMHRLAIAEGIEQSLRGSASCVGEIAASERSVHELLQARITAVAFLELIGLSPDRAEPLTNQARQFLQQQPLNSRVRAGISPHAPYTVHPQLLGNAVNLSAEQRVPVAMHIAETREELQLLRDRTGPFVDLLKELNAWYPDTIRFGSRPLDYLRTLAAAHRGLVIHGNYLDEEEQAFLAEHNARLSVIYCPRTHSFFGHANYPLRQLLHLGVRVALGTDSRASNPDLDMLAELRFLAQKHPDVSPAELIRIATMNGAYALGFEQQVGSLKPGMKAAIEMITLPDERDPYSWLTQNPCSPDPSNAK